MTRSKLREPLPYLMTFSEGNLPNEPLVYFYDIDYHLVAILRKAFIPFRVLRSANTPDLDLQQSQQHADVIGHRNKQDVCAKHRVYRRQS